MENRELAIGNREVEQRQMSIPTQEGTSPIEAIFSSFITEFPQLLKGSFRDDRLFNWNY